MFEGVQDQFHQFLGATTVAPPPPPQMRAPSNNSVPLSFSLFHASINSPPFPTIFETYPPPPPLQPPTHHHQMLQQPVLDLQYPQIKSVVGLSVKQEGLPVNQDLGGHPWSHDEVLALFRVRSAMENWFPQFTWEHVSRKMEEIGFRRSPQKCKEKFDEESGYLQTTTTTTTSTIINADEVISCPTKSYRLFSELEELCHHGCEDLNDIVLEKQIPQVVEEEEEIQEREEDDDDHQGRQDRLMLDENYDGSEGNIENHHQIAVDETDEVEKETKVGNNNGKKKFKIFKSFCEDIVNKMMVHQEELHNKIIQDLVKREEEKVAREEAWKKQEMERINKDMEARAKDQATARDRQAKIIEFLRKFTSDTNAMIINKNTEETGHPNPSSSATHSTSLNPHIPTSSNDESHSQTSNSNKILKPRPKKKPYDRNSHDHYDDVGKRWPREEVIALINIRCNLDSTNNTRPDIDCNEVNKNPPLWERISKSMMGLGYKRSAKRCKEKWENINKYFRKTKDSKKKRSVDSRTCPYFHQLSHLYSHGRISGGSHGGAGGSSLSNIGGDGGGATLNVSDQGEVNGVLVTTSACDF